jgi:hypothetical protein
MRAKHAEKELKRRKKWERQEKKEARSRQRHLESLRRVLSLFGVLDLFETLPEPFQEAIQRLRQSCTPVRACPSLEALPDSERIVSEVIQAIETPKRVIFGGKDINVSFNDLVTFFPVVREDFRSFYDWLRSHRNRGTPKEVERVGEIARKVAGADKNVLLIAHYGATARIGDVLSGHMDLERYILDYKLVPFSDGGGRRHIRLLIRSTPTDRVRVTIDGEARLAYRFGLSYGTNGAEYIEWDLGALGLGRQGTKLPVYVQKHALERLHERIPFAGHRGSVLREMHESLAYPTVLPSEEGKHLVAMDLGRFRMGYFVVQILPEIVLVRTFLFITMQGTPEAAALRRRLGLRRTDIELHGLDDFKTFLASDLRGDPELRKIFEECGCGGILSIAEAGKLPPLQVGAAARLRNHVGLPGGASDPDSLPTTCRWDEAEEGDDLARDDGQFEATLT